MSFLKNLKFVWHSSSHKLSISKRCFHTVFQDSLACSNRTREQTPHGSRTWSGEQIREFPEFLSFRTVRKKWRPSRRQRELLDPVPWGWRWRCRCPYLKVPNRSQKTSKCGKNISDTLGYASCANFLFLPHFDVIYDLLLNRRTATCNLFVKVAT